VDGFQKSVADLQIKVDQLITHPPIVNSADRVFETVEINITKSAAPRSAASSSAAALGLLATGDPTSHRGLGHGLVTTYVPTPVKGANLIPSTVSPNFTAQQFFALNQAIPRQEFPKFDGMNPKLWKKRVESYFDVYAVPEHLWVKIGLMNFTCSVAFWSQSVESILQRCNWTDLCTTICSCFEHDQ
jgi:hypothetical protein